MNIEDKISWHRDQILLLRSAIVDIDEIDLFGELKTAGLSAVRDLMDLHARVVVELEDEVESSVHAWA